MLIGLALIFVGIIFLVVSVISAALSEKGKVDIAIGGFIGPIPFGFLTSKKAFYFWLALLILGLVLWFLAKNLQ